MRSGAFRMSSTAIRSCSNRASQSAFLVSALRASTQARACGASISSSQAYGSSSAEVSIFAIVMVPLTLPSAYPGSRCSLNMRATCRTRIVPSYSPSAGFDQGRTTMSDRSLAGALALTAAALALSIDGARAFDESKFPDWKGQWIQLGGPQSEAWDPAA